MDRLFEALHVHTIMGECVNFITDGTLPEEKIFGSVYGYTKMKKGVLDYYHCDTAPIEKGNYLVTRDDSLLGVKETYRVYGYLKYDEVIDYQTTMVIYYLYKMN